MNTETARRHSPLLACGLLMWLGAGPSVAATIDWVDFSAYSAGSQSQTGFTSIDGLTVDASFSNRTNFNGTSPAPLTALLDDPLWPFDNTAVPLLTAIGSTADIATQLTLSFTSTGGLPAGGSLAIVDLEFSTSSVVLEGLVAGSGVAVIWGVANYQVEGANVLPPVWNAATSTLTGPGGTSFPSVNNFVFLTTDVALDQIRLTIQGGAGDGIGFGVSADTVPAVVPLPGTAALLLTACAAVVARRRLVPA